MACFRFSVERRCRFPNTPIMYSSTRRDHHLYKFGCGFHDPAKIQNQSGPHSCGDLPTDFLSNVNSAGL